MVGSDRFVFGGRARVTPLSLWMAQRISAVLLGPAVLVHIAVVDAWKNPAAQGLLLVVLATHAYTGMWRLVGTKTVSPIWWTAASAVAVALTATCITLGVLVLASLF